MRLSDCPIIVIMLNNSSNDCAVILMWNKQAFKVVLRYELFRCFYYRVASLFHYSSVLSSVLSSVTASSLFFFLNFDEVLFVIEFIICLEKSRRG